MHFSSKDFLSKKIKEFKDKGRKFAAKELVEFYNRDFYSLRPITNDEVVLRKFAKRKSNNIKLSARSNSQLSENLDEFEDLIGDDEFASFINDRGEIQVGDSIYKYTNRGLFFVHQNDMKHLENYLENHFNNRGLAFRNSEFDPCDYASKEGGVRQMDDRIMRYVHLADDDCNYENNGGGTYHSSNPSNDFESFINSLPESKGSKGFFDFLLGKSRTCIEKFSSGYRVKTKFWNQDYFIYSSIGVSVRHQKKFIFWWTVDTDEIALGINQVYFEYNLPTAFKPDIPKNEHFIYEGEMYNSEAQYIRTLYKPSLPNINPLFDKSVVIVVNLSNYGIYKVSAEKINKLMWGGLWEGSKYLLKKLRKSKPDRVTLLGFTSQKVIVNHINISQRAKNEGRIRKIFDWQAGLALKLGLGSDGGIGFDGVGLPSLYDYDKVKIDVYGVARRGNTWKGSRLVYDD